MKKIALLAALCFTVTTPLLAEQEIVIGGGNAPTKNTASATQPKSLAKFYENALYRNVSDPFSGNRDGTVALVEFFDYQCIHCIAMSSVLNDLVEKNSNLKVVYKIYSLGRPTSTRAALAALAAQKQGKFIDFHYGLLTANQELTDEVIFSTAQNAGLNIAQLQKDMQSNEVESKLNANLKLAHQLKIPGTPAFFIAPTKGGKPDATSYFIGEISNTSLQSAIDRAGK